MISANFKLSPIFASAIGEFLISSRLDWIAAMMQRQ
jgi:hypothetical protein